MYRYEYVPLHTGGGMFFDNGTAEHREIIAQYAAEGWHYVGYIPTQFTGNGGHREIDLIFEREEN